MSEMEQAPTRAAVLALREERKVVSEAYDFLDEKRLLLAAELLRQLERYARLQGELAAQSASARERLRAAVNRHGLQGLSVYPGRRLDGLRLADPAAQLHGSQSRGESSRAALDRARHADAGLQSIA